MSGASLGQIQLEIDGEGPPIVFLHGLGATSSSFQPLLDSMGGFRCIRPDLPGAGRSALPFGKITIEALVEAVRDILRTVAGAPAHLVAHSMGTLVALHVAATAPDAVLSLTLFGPDRRAWRRGARAPARSRSRRPAKRNDRRSRRHRGGGAFHGDEVQQSRGSRLCSGKPLATGGRGFRPIMRGAGRRQERRSSPHATPDASRDRRGRPDCAADRRARACGGDQGR